MKLGKLPARDDAGLPAFRLPAGYTPPATRTWSTSLTNLGPMLNLGYKCCTLAGAGHLLQAWTAAKGEQFVLPDPEVYSAYKTISGCDPQGTPPSDSGAYALDVLTYWRDKGLAGRKLKGFAPVRSKDRALVMGAIDLCVGVYTGLQLPMSAEQQPDWRVKLGDTTGPWRGHMIAVLDYNEHGLLCVTWGRLQVMTWRYWDAYSDETWALFSDDQPADPRRDELARILFAA